MERSLVRRKGAMGRCKCEGRGIEWGGGGILESAGKKGGVEMGGGGEAVRVVGAALGRKGRVLADDVRERVDKWRRGEGDE